MEQTLLTGSGEIKREIIVHFSGVSTRLSCRNDHEGVRRYVYIGGLPLLARFILISHLTQFVFSFLFLSFLLLLYLIIEFYIWELWSFTWKRKREIYLSTTILSLTYLKLFAWGHLQQRVQILNMVYLLLKVWLGGNIVTSNNICFLWFV